jgi:hypothetical protein
MNDFVDFSLNAKGLNVANPRKGYAFANITASVCAYDIGTASLVQSEVEVACDVLEVSGALTSSKTFQLFFDATSGKGNKLYTIMIPKGSLVAKTGGPFTITFSTGSVGKETVVIPIAPAGDTITSNSLLFDLYVDSLGNVSTKGWEISGSNSNGTWIKFVDGTMTVAGILSAQQTTSSSGPWATQPFNANALAFTFPATFILIRALRPTVYSGVGYPWIGYTLNITGSGFAVYLYGHAATDTGYINYSAEGTWK